MTEIKTERQQFDRRFCELDASGAAILRTIIELSMLLLKTTRTAPEHPPQDQKHDT